MTIPLRLLVVLSLQEAAVQTSRKQMNSTVLDRKSVPKLHNFSHSLPGCHVKPLFITLPFYKLKLFEHKTTSPHHFSRTSNINACAYPTKFTRRQLLAACSALPLTSILISSSFASEAQPDQVSFEALPCPYNDCRPVEIHDYRVGTGRAVQPGSSVLLKWTGRLSDRYGWPIQNEEADPVKFTLGKDTLIQGFEMALMGMHEGGKRRMLIPAELGYLNERNGPLPMSYGDRRRLFATVLNQRRFKRAGDLVIDVQLLKVRDP